MITLEPIKEPITYTLILKGEVVATFANKQSYKTFKKWFRHLEKVSKQKAHKSY